MFGLLGGGAMGFIMKERSFNHNPGWVIGYLFMGVLWGLYSASYIRSTTKKEDAMKGELYTAVNDQRMKREQKLARKAARKERKLARKERRRKKKAGLWDEEP